MSEEDCNGLVDLAFGEGGSGAATGQVMWNEILGRLDTRDWNLVHSEGF